MQNYKDQCVPPTSSPIYHPINNPELQEDLVPSPKSVLSTSCVPALCYKRRLQRRRTPAWPPEIPVPLGSRTVSGSMETTVLEAKREEAKQRGDKEGRHTVIVYEL